MGGLKYLCQKSVWTIDWMDKVSISLYFWVVFFFLFCFQQTKKYILNLKALVNLGITCSETLTNFIVCKFNEILGSTNVKLSRLGHVELCKDCSTRIPCIHGFTTQSKIKGEKTNLGSGGQKQPVAKFTVSEGHYLWPLSHNMLQPLSANQQIWI